MTRRRKTSATKGGERGFWFDEEAASKGDRFFRRYLRHFEGEWAGQAFAPLEWQRDRILRPLFGWKRPDGTRRYRSVYCEIAKKNGKSGLCAGLGLYFLTADGEAGAEVYSAAADRDQARIVFDVARKMAEASPEISKRVKVYRSAIAGPRNSVYRVLSADAPTKHGLKPHAVIFDELHAQPNRELWDALRKGVVARRQPVVIAITNSGFDRQSICWERHVYAEQVRDGLVPDDSHLPILYNTPTDADPFDEALWAQANPALGSIIKLDNLRIEAMEARQSPATLNTFRRLNLSQWTESESRWLDMDLWRECGGAIKESDLEGRECFAGLDLSTTTDLSAFVLVFPPKADGERWNVLCRFWCPAEGIAARSRRDRVSYDVWSNAGWIEATEGNVVDYDVIRARINELSQRFRIREIGVDRWNATQLKTQLMGDGLDIVDFGQGFGAMSGPSKEFLKIYSSKMLCHGDNPVLTWMASNVMAEMNAAGDVKPSKGRSRERIDGIPAVVMAIGRATVQEDSGFYVNSGVA